MDQWVIATSTDRMQSDIDTLNDYLGKMERAFEEAWDAVEALHATWEGPAHDELVGQFMKDQGIMRSMMEDLRSYREGLEYAKKEYVTSESNVLELVGSMNV